MTITIDMAELIYAITESGDRNMEVLFDLRYILMYQLGDSIYDCTFIGSDICRDMEDKLMHGLSEVLTTIVKEGFKYGLMLGFPFAVTIWLAGMIFKLINRLV